MRLKSWGYLGVLLLASIVAAEQSLVPEDEDTAWTEEEVEIFEELTEEDYNDLALALSEMGTTLDDDIDVRGFKSGFKVISRGLMKGVKAIGKGGKKLIKITGKGLMKGGKKLGKVGVKLGKGVGKGLIKVTVAGGKGMIKVGKSAGKLVSKGSKKVWSKIKEKFKGKMGQAAKKLVKYIAKKGLEELGKVAIQAVTPLLLEYIANKTFESMCSCKDVFCVCCATPPGFSKICLSMRVRPKLRFFNAAITYDMKEQLILTNVTGEQTEPVCGPLPTPLNLFRPCITPLGTLELDDPAGGFRGCIAISLLPTPLEREMCVEYKGKAGSGTLRWLHPSEIDTIGEDE